MAPKYNGGGPLQTKASNLTETKGHALARAVLLFRPAGNPARIGVVKMDVCFQDVAKSTLASKMAEGEEVTVESPI